MDASLVAIALRHAPTERAAAWKQQAMSGVLERWETECPADFNRVLYNKDSGWLIEIHAECDGLGQYGWDSNYSLQVRVDETLAGETGASDDYQDSLRAYVDALEDELCAVVGAVQEQSQFSPKEFAAFLLYQHGTIDERQAADALEVTVGTYRGKLGRIQNKIDAARFTLDLIDAVDAEKQQTRAEQNNWEYGNLIDSFLATEYPAKGLLRDDIIREVQNFITVREHHDDVVYYDTIVNELPERFDGGEISTYRARYELERAIDKGLVERDGDVVTVAD